MSNTTLSQWVGIRKGASQEATSRLTVLHRDSQKASSYQGLTKKYRPKDEEGEKYPDESKKVVLLAENVLKEARDIESGWWDVIASCEYGNQQASADLVVDGQVLVRQATVPLLLFLDKRFKDLRTFIEKLPTLDPNEDWEKDANSDLYKTPRQTTHRTRKVSRPLVLYPATPEHPAQTQMVSEDEVAGWWDSVKTSGALPVPRQRELLARVDKLIRGVKFAIEEANRTATPEIKISDATPRRRFSSCR